MKFQDVMAQLREDCNKYHFCQDGLRGVAKATSVENCVAMLRENIVYCFNSDYHQAIAENVEECYRNWKTIFNACGVWVNEQPFIEKGLIILTRDCTNIYATSYGFGVRGTERCFVFGEKDMIVGVFNTARIYSKNPHAIIRLYDKSHGFIHNAELVEVKDYASAYVDHVQQVVANGYGARLFYTPDCEVIDYEHKKLEVMEHFSFQ